MQTRTESQVGASTSNKIKKIFFFFFPFLGNLFFFSPINKHIFREGGLFSLPPLLSVVMVDFVVRVYNAIE